jgi:cellobiose phosphorylase
MKLHDIKLNNWGHFNEEPGSFTITEYNLARPWGYIYTSDNILLRIDHKGCGYAQVNPPSGIMLFKPERYEKLPLFFVWFKEAGESAFSNFFKPSSTDITSAPEKFECTFRPEYAEYNLTFNGWKIISKLSISSDSPSIIMQVSIENKESRMRELDINPVWRPHNTKADLALWDVPELYQSCKFFNNHGTGIMVETRDPEAQISNRKYTTMLTDLPINGAELRYEEYIGGGSAENPEALCRKKWLIENNSTFKLEDFRAEDAVISQLPIAALQGKKTFFKAGGKVEFTVVLHHLQETDYTELASETENACKLLSAVTWDKNIQTHNQLYNNWMSRFQIKTPDPALNQYINEWLIMQLYWVSKLDRGWPTGMRGTRDAAQDYSGISYLKPELGKIMLNEMFACQRFDGSFLRQFSCLGVEGKHDERDYVDSGCWVFELLYDYLCLSGDNEFLNKKITWLNSEINDTVETHAKRLLEYYLNDANRGEHGLVKIKAGDWNDSINNAGLLGIGESVMVSCHVVYLLKLAQDIFSHDSELCKLYAENAAQLKANLRKHALNDAGFLNGVFTDNKEWLFSNHDQDGVERFNSPVNSFGIIAQIFEPEELSYLFDKIEALKGPNGYRLFYPPLGRETIKMAGRMGTGDLYPGNAENGTVYNHGSQGFLLRALTSAGDGDRAFDVLKHIFSYDQNLHPVEKCKTEPYGVLNCWNEIQGRECEGEKVFLSGTISTVFRGIYNGIMGIHPTLNGLKIKPCLPNVWDKASCRFNYKSSVIELKISRSSETNVKVFRLNNQEVNGQFIPTKLFNTNKLNTIEIIV